MVGCHQLFGCKKIEGRNPFIKLKLCMAIEYQTKSKFDQTTFTIISNITQILFQTFKIEKKWGCYGGGGW